MKNAFEVAASPGMTKQESVPAGKPLEKVEKKPVAGPQEFQAMDAAEQKAKIEQAAATITQQTQQTAQSGLAADILKAAEEEAKKRAKKWDVGGPQPEGGAFYASMEKMEKEEKDAVTRDRDSP